MKNKALLATIILTVITISFMLGIAVGRNTVSNPISDNQTKGGLLETQLQDTTASGHGILNINLASKDDLVLLPGIGEVLAQSIIDYRTRNGPFSSIEELLNVSGIGNKKLDGLKEYISVGG